MIPNCVIIPGKPVPQSRPRVYKNKRGQSVAFEESAATNAKRYVKMLTKSYMNKNKIKRIEEGAVGYMLEFIFPLPESWSIKKKIEMSDKYKVSKPDTDNLEKLVLDALSGIAWKDDAQLAFCSGIKKRYAHFDPETRKQEQPFTYIEWEEVPLKVK